MKLLPNVKSLWIQLRRTSEGQIPPTKLMIWSEEVLTKVVVFKLYSRLQVSGILDIIILTYTICLFVEFISSIPDPVHKYVRITSLEKTIIDLPQFQRLSRIKQLGFANIAFPGALHTRFEHSLGTLQVADLIFDRFKNEFDEIDWQKVRLAGLLHDIGHSAFSHTIELGLKRMEKIVQLRYNEHEEYTWDIIVELGNELRVKEALKDAGIKRKPNDFFKEIGGIATGKKEGLCDKDKFLSNIISGEIGADRIDYLIRDGLHTGINFVGFSLQHILENISRNKDRIIIGKKGENRSFDEVVSINLGEAFLISRYHYYSNIVNHPRNIATNLMLIKALEKTIVDLSKNLGKEEIKNELDKFFLEYDDNDILNFIMKHQNKEALGIIESLRNGEIFSCVCDLKSHASAPEIKFYLYLMNKRPYLINNIEKRINETTKEQELYLCTSEVGGIPHNLRVKTCKTDSFLYDESKLAASLIMEILSSESLYFYCSARANVDLCNDIIKKNWIHIQHIIEQEINKERRKEPYHEELLLLFFYECLRTRRNFQIPMMYITNIYNRINWIQKNSKNPFHYKFSEDFGFLYSPELFEDIMKLGSIGLLKVIIEEKGRPISDYGVKNNRSLLDYFDERNHVYYQFEMTPNGRGYCSKIIDEYSSYQFLSELPNEE